MITTLIPGQLTVCVYAGFPPIGYKKSTGELVGLDISFLTLFAESLGLKVTTIENQFNGIWTLPSANQCDIAAGSIMKDESRLVGDNASWSDAYFITKRSLIVRLVDKNLFDDYKQLQSKIIVVTRESMAKMDAIDRYPNCIIQYVDAVASHELNSLEYIVQSLLLKHKIDAYAGGEAPNKFICNRYSNVIDGEITLADVHSVSHKPDSFNFVVRNASVRLLEKLNDFIAKNKNLYAEQMDFYINNAKLINLTTIK